VSLWLVLTAPPAEAREHWRRWREEVDVNALDAESMAILPLLKPRLEEWLGDDPAGPIFLGICKQAWSGNQVLLRQLQALWAAWTERGIAPLAIGGAASALLAADRTLPIRSFEAMVPLDSAKAAVEISERLGWRRMVETPDWVRFVNPAGQEFRLLWRRFSSAPDLACEVSQLRATAERVEWMGTVFAVPPAEWRLREILSEPRRPTWRCEAFLANQSETRISATSKPRALLRDYLLWRRQQTQAPSSPLRYLRLRWNAQSNRELPALLLRALRLYWR
jgi:hypothetical protein